jgi:predicted nuclease with TOPRIM domain
VDVAVITRETMANDLINELTTKLVEARKIIKKLEQENTWLSQTANYYLQEADQLRKSLQPTEEELEARRNAVLL